jgi:hypothetical protein
MDEPLEGWTGWTGRGDYQVSILAENAIFALSGIIAASDKRIKKDIIG